MIWIAVGLGILVLFMFPEPESNFDWYVLTGFLFAVGLGIFVWVRKYFV